MSEPKFKGKPVQKHPPQKHAPQKHAPQKHQPRRPQAVATLLIPPSNVCKVLKGEIHNVLNVLRADARYVPAVRFMEELPTEELHPLLFKFRALHKELSEWELANHSKPPPPRMYLPPFHEAIQLPDISAAVTGAALHAIHKFVLYGFLSTEPGAYTAVAKTLLKCTFEESEPPPVDTDGRRRNVPKPSPTSRDDEQVVLKLLDLSSLVIRCASLDLQPDVIGGLLDTCLHVSHRAKRASVLLKSAATDALGQIVLQVFSQPNLSRARIAILNKLSSLLNPQRNSDAYVVNSLTLVNIALETLTGQLTPDEITVLKDDLCKYLLSWSTTHDMIVLSLTMRVIFNLFMRIRNHLKVPLEVFLTSVHLRILEHSRSPEEREVALESLLEFCQEPALMKDLYLNYDCDVNCTNLYATICSTLGNVAAPVALTQGVVEVDKALEPTLNGGPNHSIAQKSAAAASDVPVNVLNSLALEGLLTIVESIARRVKSASKDPSMDKTRSSSENGYTEGLDDQIAEEMIKEKAALAEVAKAFNKNPHGTAWIYFGKDLGVLVETPESVADALYKAPGIDKAKLGEYLGKGPIEAYPFEHKVRLAFVEKFDFSKGKTFASALRIFLHKFRLPGEAQCIDRFMDCFSKEFYKQQGAASVFNSADGVFVLAFSTIMLNTDLHNPTIKNRMTIDQFISNNRGINDGEDLPVEMLRKLYGEIKDNEIQVQREIGEFISHSEAADAEHFRSAWDDLLAKDVAKAAFTPQAEAVKTMNQLGLHDKDMFMVIAKPALKSISSAFIRTWDDVCILECLRGLEQMARISTYFGLEKTLNDVISFLLGQGREFIAGCVSLEYHGIDSGAPVTQPAEDDETMSIVDPDSPLPKGVLQAKEIAEIDPKMVDISGSAPYRGLLALNMGLRIVRTLFPWVKSAWKQLTEVICCLRDARALPSGLCDLDDFADSDGNVLPLSPFAQDSQKKLDEFYKGSTGRDKGKGWFKLSLFGRKGKKGEEPERIPEKERTVNRGQLTANTKTLIAVCKRIDIEQIIVLGPNVNLNLVQQGIQGLLGPVDEFPAGDNPYYEQHTAFALELAVRALFANRERANDLLPYFLRKFESLAAKINKQQDVLYPFVAERVAVTILRTTIHLFSIAPFRPKIRTALFLLPAFPKDTFIAHVADRMACGLAIILRNSYFLFKEADEWKFIADTFDVLADFELGRTLVFDGVASTVEYALPHLPKDDIEQYEEALQGTATLTLQSSSALQKVMLKFMHGDHEGDMSLSVPAMVCVEKIYKHMVQLILIRQSHEDPDSDLDSVPDKELWHRVAVGMYSVCCQEDKEGSKEGLIACQRQFMGVFMEEIPDKLWIAVLNTMTSKQPPITAEVARVNTLSLLGQMMLRLFPIMTKREANWKILTEITKEVIIIADENMQSGTKPLYDATVKIVANVAQGMISPNFGGEKRYCKWASDTFVKALEKNGALKGMKK